ncbi:nuclear transport factor 2 family protein [Devosia sp. A8/3-2]|nr:nuclear transport factor 2 family protein [Devosia sp. A8/3-2]
MPDIALPPVLQAFRTAVNAGDSDAFIAFFPADGVVEDWGRRFSGHQAILNWSAKELIGAKGILTYGEVIRNRHWPGLARHPLGQLVLYRRQRLHIRA